MMTQISNFRFMANPEAESSFHDDGVVIFHAGKGSLFSSNRTGAQIWRGVEQKLSVDQIAQQISGEYQIELTTAREHTFGFITDLHRHALVQREVVS